MIESIVNKTILDGIKHFSIRQNSQIENTGIRVYFDENDLETVKYDMCIDWQPIETVSFKQILNSKFDLLGKEEMATPIFYKTLNDFAEKFNAEKKNISVFLFNRNKVTGLAVFNLNEHVHNRTLSTHLSELQLL